MNDQPATPTLADQVATVDAVAAAARIVATQGTRAAIGASAIEIIGMAQLLLGLSELADLTFDMLAAADAVQAERDPEHRKALQRAFKTRVDFVGVSLEALGYGQQQQPTQQEEKTDGTAS